jgi:hypothetical protein
MFVKIVIVLVLLLIIASLGVALRHLLMDGERSTRTAQALTVRIGLSIALFFLLLLGYQAGLLHPHGLKTGANPPQAGGGQK